MVAVDMEHGTPVFANAKQAEKLIGLVMEHYNATIADLGAGRYSPVYDVDTHNDDIIWEMWIDGFEQAMHLRPESWSAYLDMDEDITTAIAGLLRLADIANGNSKLKQKDVDDLQLAAPDLIPGWVEILNAARIAKHPQSMHTRQRSAETIRAPAAPARNTRNAAASTDQSADRTVTLDEECGC